MVSRDRFARHRKTQPNPYTVLFVTSPPTYALSLKQPWAALVVAGRKTIEVRRWPTAIRGPVFIHAARVADDRTEGWTLVTDAIRPLTRLIGGVIGAAELTGCIIYRNSAHFGRDSPLHGNDPAWFVPPRMYGFTFRAAGTVPFVACKGQVRFFTVDIPKVA